MSRRRSIVPVAVSTILIAASAVVAGGIGVAASAAGPSSLPGRMTALPPVGERMWDLASDYGITTTNPQPDSYGDAQVWSWMQGSDLSSPATFSLLTRYTTSEFGIAGLDSWQGGAYSQTNDYLPQVSLNATGAPQAFGGIYWPKGTILVHPLEDNAIVRWRSPVSGTVHVTVSATKDDRNCGVGETWQLDEGGTRLAGGTVGNGAGPQGAFKTVCVAVGTNLYLAVGAVGGDYVCGSTGITLTVTM